MANKTIKLKQRDTARNVVDVLELPSGTPIDLSNSTIVMVWRNKATAEVHRRTTVAITNLPGTDGSVTYTPAAADVVSPHAG